MNQPTNPPSIADSLAGRHVVLTGVTGFLGKVWLVMLLERCPEIGRVSLLVRGGRDGAVARVERIAATSPAFRPLRERWGDQLSDFLGARLAVYDCDLARPGAGLDADALDALRSADLVLHCAGLTDFDPDPKKALAVNVDGALNAAAIAEAAGAPMIHVSTCYVAGVADGEVAEQVAVGVAPNGARFDPEALLEQTRRQVHKPRLGDRVERGRAIATGLGWPNLYTFSKGLAEHLLARRPGLQLVIARPSIVECAERFPFPGWNEGINTAGPLAWLISTAFRRLPAAPDHRFDIIPVDHVAKGLLITAAAALRGEAPQVLHLASSDVHPLTFGRTIELTGLGLRRYVRTHGGSEAERRWFRHLDPVPGDGGWFLPFELRGFLEPLRERVAPLTARDDRLGELARPLDTRLRRAAADLERIDDLLTLYRPFIREHDWCFRTDHIRALSAALPPQDADVAWSIEDLCWRRYWVDIEYPGLMKWCIPLLRGERAPLDPAPAAPIRLPHPQRAASK